MNNILIEVPTWLGDCVMTTPAIENIINTYPNVKITIFGAFVSTAIFEEHPNVERVILDESKKASSRLKWIYQQAKALGKFDVAITFRRTFFSRLFIWLTQATTKGYYRRYTKEIIHQAIRYNDFVNKTFKLDSKAQDLKICFKPFNYEKPTLGINPGASYGSAKRWYPEKFAKVATELSKQYKIIIFGGPAEVDMAEDIEKELIKANITNYQNIAGKTSIRELCEKIGGLKLFITGDSGPMHVAAAFKVPTVAIFGPTKDKETSQWMNPQGEIVKREIDCSPCMQRTCPLKHHECMKLIEAEDILKKINTKDFHV
ncbi:MAG: ADP-heptose--lipooligosaccharide heptosyltransferase II (EC [uncultured Sulfurovum sp.]|uniref:lipopolysaccharide heptosyltransferase II n=1 Tax=uncultured Sulfurovum sp. TaxID=269237 RepID=A0A6S6SMT8_9BACT|nr:MAG: ADP-heptose--lipooligosaccharide heptosyltransferase II (EC [uncultured Sulfurovum sp.]